MNAGALCVTLEILEVGDNVIAIPLTTVLKWYPRKMPGLLVGENFPTRWYDERRLLLPPAQLNKVAPQGTRPN